MSGDSAWQRALRLARVRGLASVISPAGQAGAVVLALLWARTHVTGLVERHLQVRLPHLPADFAWEPRPAQAELSLGAAQPYAFLCVLAAVVAASAAYGLVDGLLARFRATRRVAWLLRLATAAAALVLAGRVSSFAGLLAACTLVVVAIPAAGLARPGRSVVRGSNLALVAPLVAEAIGLAWGVWLTCFSSLGVLSLGLVLALVVAVAERAGALLSAEGGEATLQRDLVVGAPFLLTPLLALRRGPSPWWVFAALAASAAVFVALGSRWLGERLSRVSRWKSGVIAKTAAPWMVGAILFIPTRFRDIGDISHFEHEGQHLGWLNAASFGKWLMADTGYVYPPLREYTLGALAWLLGGLTLEHVREAHLLLNAVGVVLMAYAGWRVARGRAWLVAWWAIIVVAQTPVSFLVHYRDAISFGWSDEARVGLAAVALIGATDEVLRLRSSGAPAASGDRSLLAWGALCGVSVLYSQDFGLCAFGSVGLAIVVDALLRRASTELKARALGAVRMAAAWTAGMFAVVLLLILVYAVFGKAGLLFHRLATWARVAGVWGAQKWPFETKDYLDPSRLSAHESPVVAYAEYLVPPAVILLGASLVTSAALRGRWTARTTRLFALVLFALTSFVHGLIRVDIWHLRSDGSGALLLLLALLGECADVRLRFGAARLRRRALPVGAVVAALGALILPWSLGTLGPLRSKLERIASGEDAPATGQPYDNHAIPRAGDVQVPGNVRALTEWVHANTRPTDAVWCTNSFMRGGEYAFVLDRRNPMAFDLPQELFTISDQEEALHALQTDPPVLIVGDYFNLVGDAVRSYVAAHWKSVSVPGWGPVRRYDPSTVGPTPG